MYKSSPYHQISFFDFNCACGMQLDENNEWIRLARRIPWKELEGRYAEMFPSRTGRPAEPFRMAFGALIIAKRKGLSDRRLVHEIAENPYLQYFLGLHAFSKECPFTAVAMVSFRKRLDAAFIQEANEVCLAASSCTKEHEGEAEEEASEAGSLGTEILDATCSPSCIKFPQDFELLSKARVKLEELIDPYCSSHHQRKPRTYRQTARKEYLALAKQKRRPAKKIRAFIRKHLGYLKRNMGYIAGYLAAGWVMTEKESALFRTIQKLYEQQKYMFDNHTHRVADRIVSISQPWVRPIVRGKAKAPTEFGAKYDVSIDEKGHARIEELTFHACNESTMLIAATERYRERTGHYPERIPADQISTGRGRTGTTARSMGSASQVRNSGGRRRTAR